MKRAVVFLMLAAGCVTLPHATAGDVDRARARWPGASLRSLEDGRMLYQGRCSGCHALHSPSAHTPDQWAKAIDEMADRAKLSTQEKALLLQFLSTMSQSSG